MSAITTKIISTKNYDLFRNNPHQRSFSNAKVHSLMDKMRRNGFPASMAISVYKDGPKLVINAGHHRLAAAKQLGLPILYVVEHKWTHRELSDEGSVQSAWKVKDHVSNFAKGGSKDFMELLRLESLGLPIGMAASMLIGEQAGSGNAKRTICSGSFKIKNTTQVELWEELHTEFGTRVPCIYHRTFISAWSKCLFTPEFDYDTFVKRLRKNPSMLEKCSTEDQMLRLIEELYNHGSPRKIPLAFMVTNNSKNRKTIAFRKNRS